MHRSRNIWKLKSRHRKPLMNRVLGVSPITASVNKHIPVMKATSTTAFIILSPLKPARQVAAYGLLLALRTETQASEFLNPPRMV
jgi:hypothetical protein